jgi:glycosyltransferase involved in cell wall biosynthesis
LRENLQPREPEGGSGTPAARLPIIRVAHVIHSLGAGGAEDVLVHLASAAGAAALELVVVSLSPVDDPVHARSLRALGVAVVELDLGRWDLRAVARLVTVLRQYAVDVVHTHLKHADLVGAAAAHWAGLPVVSTLHVIEDAPRRPIDRFKRFAGTAVRRRLAARTITLSRAQQRWYRDLTGSSDNVVMVPNGVIDPGPLTPAEWQSIRNELSVDCASRLIVSASLMRPEKGHDLLLDAVASLPDHDVVLALAGDGPLRDALVARTNRDVRLRERVRFLGYRRDVPALLAAADLVVHPSRADALPTTLIQALAAGVPVVATRVGGIPDIVGDEAGLLVEPEAAKISDAIAQLLVDPDRRERIGAAGRARFLAMFEATAWALCLRATYDGVLNGKDDVSQTTHHGRLATVPGAATR